MLQLKEDDVMEIILDSINNYKEIIFLGNLVAELVAKMVTKLFENLEK